MKPFSAVACMLFALFCSLAATAASDVAHSRLPWPPSQDDRVHIADLLKDVLGRSKVPEAAELLRGLPSREALLSEDADATFAKAYVGEWRLDDDGFTLWTARVRGELLRHYYTVRFTQTNGKWSASDLDVLIAHARIE